MRYIPSDSIDDSGFMLRVNFKPVYLFNIAALKLSLRAFKNCYLTGKKIHDAWEIS